jgi:ABC-type lipopolysaccharide export system ATPase subunit
VIEIQRIIIPQVARHALITDHNVRETLGICDHATSSAMAACSAGHTGRDQQRRGASRSGENFKM